MKPNIKSFLHAAFSAWGASGWKILRHRTNSLKSITPSCLESNNWKIYEDEPDQDINFNKKKQIAPHKKG